MLHGKRRRYWTQEFASHDVGWLEESAPAVLRDEPRDGASIWRPQTATATAALRQLKALHGRQTRIPLLQQISCRSLKKHQEPSHKRHILSNPLEYTSVPSDATPTKHDKTEYRNQDFCKTQQHQLEKRFRSENSKLIQRRSL